MVTPSLVMVGAPHFLSMTTLRPFGPSVTLTASARASTPRWSESRASEWNCRIFDMHVLSSQHPEADPAPGAYGEWFYLLTTARTSRADRMRYSLAPNFTSVPPYFEKMTVSPSWMSSGSRWPFSNRPGPTARTVPSWGFSLAVSGITMPDAVVCSDSSTVTTMRSSSGLMLTLVAVVTTCLPQLSGRWTDGGGRLPSRGQAEIPPT